MGMCFGSMNPLMLITPLLLIESLGVWDEPVGSLHTDTKSC